ncbi:hypothetical protein [Lelliottia sp. WAP21]|uniref:hypothetical protein n=1 Tax=Lelliottia sp. WAP21 TaxID=2877426 RepID=UPI001E2F5B11|nr:hypothetical protein [Lelliottia sp. WAP21]
MGYIKSLLCRPVQASSPCANIQSDKKNKSAFSTMLKGVRNSLARLNRSHADEMKISREVQLQKDIAMNRLPAGKIVRGTETEQKIKLIHQEIISLNRELATLSAKIPASRMNEPVNERMNSALIHTLHQSLNKDAILGKLYSFVLSEEIYILSANGFQQRSRNDAGILTVTEQRIVDKYVIEKKLAILDFCAKVLRLHEQADWEPANSLVPTGNIVSVDVKMDHHLQSAEQKPEFASKRGIDPVSGLYHERQFKASGTCSIHANNHYLASWCEREGRPFLPLTPRRLEMLLSGLQNRITTESKELNVIAQQRGEMTAHALQNTENGFSSGENFLIRYRNNIIHYGQKEERGIAINTAATGNMITADISDVVNRLYGLPEKVSTNEHSFAKWSNRIDKLKYLEKKQDSLGCLFAPRPEKSGHAICFNKKGGEWFLQDSNSEKPVKCRPSEFILYIAGKPTNYAVQNRLSREYSYNYINTLDENSVISFYHHEPK